MYTPLPLYAPDFVSAKLTCAICCARRYLSPEPKPISDLRGAAVSARRRVQLNISSVRSAVTCADRIAAGSPAQWQTLCALSFRTVSGIPHGSGGLQSDGEWRRDGLCSSLVLHFPSLVGDFDGFD